MHEPITKVIIRNKAGVTIEQAVAKVYAVMKAGLISNGKHGKQHCFATRFADEVVVLCRRCRNRETFTVVR